MNQRNVVAPGNAAKTGIVMSPDGSGYAVDWTELPVSDHFFLATSCHLKRESTGLRMLFGTASSFETSDHYDLAVEIHFPIHEAKIYLHKSVFIELSGDGKRTYYEAIKDALKKLDLDPDNLPPEKVKKLPVNKNASFRIFPANFAAMSFSGTQALIEFFEVTPELVHFMTKRNKVRPYSGVKPVLSVILDTVIMFQFMESCRELIGQLPKEDSNHENR